MVAPVFLLLSAGLVHLSPLLAGSAQTPTLFAPMVSVTVKTNSEILISLPGWSSAGGKVRHSHAFRCVATPDPVCRTHSRRTLPSSPAQLTTLITSLPAVGTLYQISQVFSDYGYEPKRGLALNSASVASPIAITGSRNRFVYVPPWNTNAPLEAVSAFAQVGDVFVTNALDGFRAAAGPSSPALACFICLHISTTQINRVCWRSLLFCPPRVSVV